MRTAPRHDAKSTSNQKKKVSERPYNVLDIEDEDLAPAVKDVHSAIERDRRGGLRGSYKIGLAIDKHYRRLHQEDEGANWPERGERFFEQLADAVERPAAWLRNHFRLVRTYDEDSFEQLCQTPGMTATKALTLAGIDDKLRGRLVKRIADEGLSVREVEKAIQADVGPRRVPGAGRPPKRPKKLTDAFVHLTAQINKFTNLNDAVWFGKEYDIVRELKELPAGKLTDELKTQVSDAARKCDQLAATATKDAQALRGLLPEINRRMQAQAQVNAQVQAAEKACQ